MVTPRTFAKRENLFSVKGARRTTPRTDDAKRGAIAAAIPPPRECPDKIMDDMSCCDMTWVTKAVAASTKTSAS
jgi:hypothetical protein